jgi:hypothetical protein
MNPLAGRGQAVRRPAIVISPSAYNGKSGLALYCPVTSHVKGYLFEVPLPESGLVVSVVDDEAFREKHEVVPLRDAELSSVMHPDVRLGEEVREEESRRVRVEGLGTKRA